MRCGSSICEEIPGGDLYIVMEFLSGEELSQVLQREKRLSPARAADIARQTLEALGEAACDGRDPSRS